MKRPPKLSPSALIHPKAEKRSAFQGDLIRPPEEQGFSERRRVNGCTVTHGTRQPSGLKHPVDAPPRPLGRPMASPPAVVPPLTDRQQKMTRGGNGRKR